MFQTNNSVQDIKLIYVGDPMCSWCYGIAGELEKTIDHFDHLPLEMVMGGLRAGGGEEWNTAFKDFLRHHWEDVGTRTGQPFRFDLLDRSHFDYDTEPACRAVVTVLSMDKSKALPFFQLVQKGFYLENNDPKENSFYTDILTSLSLDKDVFLDRFHSSEMKQATAANFQKSAALGVRSFPTLLLQKGEKIHVIASGYSTSAHMIAKIERLLK